MKNTSIKKYIILKEQPSRVHKEKLEEVLKEAEFVAKKYVLRQWPDLWPKLQTEFREKTIDFMRPVKKELDKLNVIDVEPKHLDLTNFSSLLQNATSSPLCSKPKDSLYQKAWIGPNEDMKEKLKKLQDVLRENNSSLTLKSEEDLLEHDIKEILDRSSPGDKITNVNSYLWLVSEGRPSEALLSAHYKQNGGKSCLSALKLAFSNFSWNEYAFVNYMSILRSKRNAIHAIYEPFIPLASYNKDYHIINECIQNLFTLMLSTCNGDEVGTKDVEDIRITVQERIESILCRTSYEAETTTMFEQVELKFQSSVSVGDTSTTGILENVVIDSSTNDILFFAIANCNRQESRTSENNSVNNSNDNWTLQDDGNFVCKICGIPVNNVIGMKAHEDGKTHKKKLQTLNSANVSSVVTPSVQPKENIPPLTQKEREQRAVQLTMTAFIESFDPIPKPCAILRGTHVISQSDVERIRSQPSREERVVEFLEIIQEKQDFFKHLQEVLKPTYQNLCQQLLNNLQ